MTSALAVAAVVVAVVVATRAEDPAGCTAVASPEDDLGAFVNGLRPGDVGCLHAGSYGAREERISWRVSGTRTARIRLQGVTGERPPAILGPFTFEGDYLTASGLLFDGPSGPAGRDSAIAVWINGDHDALEQSEVRDAESQGVYLDGADHVRLVDNYIHDNGDKDDPRVANLHHGIYFKSGSGVIHGNLIARNYSFGVHLYPSAHDVTVTGNTVVGHGRAGVIIAGEPGEPLPANNVVADNVIVSNGDRPVTSFGPLALGNVVEDNVYWANGTAGSTTGLVTRRNVERDPGIRLLHISPR